MHLHLRLLNAIAIALHTRSQMVSHDDSDWLDPDDSPEPDSSSPLRVSFSGVYRVEAQGEEATPFHTLIEATAEPPMSPEAEVRGPGGCLAQCTADRAVWFFTQLGAARIEREARVPRKCDAVIPPSRRVAS
jgi:hypothetical protein